MPLVDSLIENFGKDKVEKLSKHPMNTGIIIKIGYTSTYVIPVLDGEVKKKYSSRINVGTRNVYEYLCREMMMKYSHLTKHLDHNNLSTIYTQYLHCPSDYEAQLCYYKNGIQAFKTVGYCHPLVSQRNNYFLQNGDKLLKEPLFIEFYETAAEKKLQEEELERKKKLRLEQSKRIREAINKKNEEKKRQNEIDLNRFEEIMEEINQEEEEQAIDEILENNDFLSVSELKGIIKKLKIKLKIITKEELEKERYSYIKIPDSELTPHQLKVKRLQIMQKQGAEKRILEKLRKQKLLEKQEKMKKENPEGYKKDLNEKRIHLRKKIKTLRRFKEDSLMRKNKQRRMFSILDEYIDGKSVNDKKVEEEFMKLTEEMNQNEDLEEYEQQLNEVEIELRDIDSDFEDENTRYANLFRPVEILFKPYLIGNNQMGITELCLHLASKFPDRRNELLSRIQLSGAGATISSIDERIRADIQTNLDCKFKVKVRKGGKRVISPWQSMREFYLQSGKYPENLIWITKENYFEYGGENILQNFCYANDYDD